MTDSDSTVDWERRLADPSEPLFTMAVVADLLGLDHQALRRLETGLLIAARSTGNHRRYSRDDIALLAYAARLADEGLPKPAIARVISLEQQVARLAAAAGHTVDVHDRAGVGDAAPRADDPPSDV